MKTVRCIDKEKNLHEVNASDLVWRPAAYGIIIQDGHILLVPQWDGYDLPGGGVDLGETVEEGVIREVKEETGMDVISGDLIEYRTNFFKPTGGIERYYESLLFYYTCTITGGSLSTDGFDEEEKEYARLAEWIPLSEIENIKFHSSVDLVPIIQKTIS